MIPMYNTKTFSEIFPKLEDFKDNYDLLQSTAGLTNKLDNNDVSITWQLLTAKYGNNPIANWSEEQFKLKVWQIMFQYGPTWAKRLEIQENVRGLDLSEIQQGDFSVYNTALAPDSAPSPDVTAYINQQNTTNKKKSKLGAYNELLMILDTDVTEEYIGKFKKLFLSVVDPKRTFIYMTEDEGDE